MEKYSNYLEFYEEKVGGGYDTEPCCYKIEGDTFDSVNDITDVAWQAVEIDGLDNSRVLVKMRIEDRSGDVVCTDMFYIETKAERTEVPSKYIVWGDKEPHIFEIDRKKSSMEIKEYMTTKPNWMKRCPFCNGEVYIAHTSHIDLKNRRHHYVCQGCNATVFLEAKGKYLSQEATDAEAMNIWNDSPFVLPQHVL